MKNKITIKAPGLISALCIIILLFSSSSCGKTEVKSFNFDYKSEKITKYITAADISSVTDEELENYASSIAAGSVLYDTDGADKLFLPGDRVFFRYEISSGDKTESGDTSLVIGGGTFLKGFDDAVSYLTFTMGREREISFILEDGFSQFEKGENVAVSITPTLVVPRHVYEAVTFYSVQEKGALIQNSSVRDHAMFGDTVEISYKIYSGEELVKEENGRILIVGSLEFEDVFEKAVIGLKTSECREFFYLAENDRSAPEYAGNELKAVVTLDAVRYRTFDDDMAKSLGYSSADEYKDEYDRGYLMANALRNALTSRAAIKQYPKGLIDFYTEWYISSFEELYNYYSGVYGQMFTVLYPTFEDFIVKFAEFESMDDFKSEADADAKRNAFSDLLTFYYALEYGIELSDDEYAVGAAKIAADYNYTSIDGLIAGGYTEYQLRTELLKEKTLTSVYEVYSENK